MRIAKYIHSCVLLEKPEGRILFDPGKFSFLEGKVSTEEFTGIGAVLLTHAHADHAEIGAIKRILAANPGAEVLTNPAMRSKLEEEGVASTLFERGEREVAGFRVAAHPAKHADLLGAEVPDNTAFVVDGRVLNPGDSFSPELDGLKGTEVLLLPVSAPWLRELDAAAFAERMEPKRVVPVHDGYLKDFFLKGRYAAFSEYFRRSGIQFDGLTEAGASIEI